MTCDKARGSKEPIIFKRRVLILDQFVGPTPYDLQQKPIRFADLIDVSLRIDHRPWRKPEVKDVPEDYVPEMCTTVYIEGEDGNAVAWRYRWDSSG